MAAGFTACVPIPPPRCELGEDADGDGWPCVGDDADLPADCDDDDPGVHPGALDEPGRGVDGDCLGGPAERAPALTPVTLRDVRGALVADTGGTVLHVPVGLMEGGYRWTDAAGRDLLAVRGDEAPFSALLGDSPAGSLMRDDLSVDAVRAVVELEWNDYTVPVDDVRTRFHLYADDRMFREDVFVVDDATPPALPHVTLVVDAERFTRLRGEDVLEDRSADLVFAPSADAATWLCLIDDPLGRTLGVAWAPETTGALRATVSSDASRLTLDHAAPFDGAGPVGTHVLFSEVALTAEGANCNPIVDAAARWARPCCDVEPLPPTVFALDDDRRDTAQDGYLDAAGSYALVGADGRYQVQVQRSLPRLVLELDDAGGAGVVVWRNGERLTRGTDFLWSPGVLLIATALEPGELIRVVAAPGAGG